MNINFTPKWSLLTTRNKIFCSMNLVQLSICILDFVLHVPLSHSRLSSHSTFLSFSLTKVYLAYLTNKIVSFWYYTICKHVYLGYVGLHSIAATWNGRCIECPKIIILHLVGKNTHFIIFTAGKVVGEILHQISLAT